MEGSQATTLLFKVEVVELRKAGTLPFSATATGLVETIVRSRATSPRTREILKDILRRYLDCLVGRC